MTDSPAGARMRAAHGESRVGEGAPSTRLLPGA